MEFPLLKAMRRAALQKPFGLWGFHLPDLGSTGLLRDRKIGQAQTLES
jgi:hypothetical protein